MRTRSARTVRSLALVLVALGGLEEAAAQGSAARYRVTFDATWSQQTHAGAYPNFAHFSPLVGGTHSAAADFWEEGGLATNGIEQMAETGVPNFLRNEVLAAVAAGTANNVIAGGGAVSPGMTVTHLTLDQDFPLVTLVTMIAPSPDWFVGVDSVPLFVNGEWLDELVLDLPAFDAGTDSGQNFGAPNQNTNPADPITRIQTGPLAGLPPMGRFTFTRVASTWVFGCGTNPEGSLVVEGLPRLTQTVSFHLDDVNDVLATPALSSLTLSMQPDAAFPCGTFMPGFGLAGAGQGSELLLSAGPYRRFAGPVSSGEAVTISLTIPNRPLLVGRTFFAQGALVDANGHVGLTEAVELFIGE